MTTVLEALPELLDTHPANLSTFDRELFYSLRVDNLTPEQKEIAEPYLELARSLLSKFPQWGSRTSALEHLVLSREAALRTLALPTPMPEVSLPRAGTDILDTPTKRQPLVLADLIRVYQLPGTLTQWVWATIVLRDAEENGLFKTCTDAWRSAVSKLNSTQLSRLFENAPTLTNKKFHSIARGGLILTSSSSGELCLLLCESSAESRRWVLLWSQSRRGGLESIGINCSEAALARELGISDKDGPKHVFAYRKRSLLDSEQGEL